MEVAHESDEEKKKNILNFLAAATRRSFRVELKTKKDARLDRVGKKYQAKEVLTESSARARCEFVVCSYFDSYVASWDANCPSTFIIQS